METIGERVTRLRSEKKWTQDQLAKEAGIAQSTVNGVEKGARQKRPSSLIKIAHALGVDANWLRTGIGKQGGAGIHLTEEEELLLRALPLLDPGTKRSWFLTAKDVLEQHDSSKQKAA